MRLDQLEPGQTARLVKTPQNLKRLEELGFVVGAEVKLIQRGFLGTPLLFWVSGTKIAIRAEDAKLFEVIV